MATVFYRPQALETIARRTLSEYDPMYLNGSPRAVPIETIIEKTFGLRIEYQYLTNDARELGRMIYDIRNEDKFSKRAKRSISIFDFSEETEEHHPEIAANDLEEEAILNEMAEQVRDAIAQLKPILRERLIKYFFEGKSLLQIAAEEGKSYSTVYESYQAALKKLKKYLKIPDNLTSLSPNK